MIPPRTRLARRIHALAAPIPRPCAHLAHVVDETATWCRIAAFDFP
jgi:hypothetical protein